MTTYHRYIVADAKGTTFDQLSAVVRESHAGIDFDHEVVLRDGEECGILIDVTKRSDPIFDDDLALIKDRLASSGAFGGRTYEVLDAAQCMVTVQVTNNADESVLEAIWSALRSYCPGILVMEGSTSVTRYDQ